jgi:hypothetical protein
MTQNSTYQHTVKPKGAFQPATWNTAKTPAPAASSEPTTSATPAGSSRRRRGGRSRSGPAPSGARRAAVIAPLPHG